MQEVKNLLARVFNFAVFQTKEAKTIVFTETRKGFKSFYRKTKTLLLIVFNTIITVSPDTGKTITTNALIKSC